MYREVRPHAALKEHVKCCWLLDREYRGPQATETVWPDGRVELLFHFGDRYEIQHGDRAEKLAHGFVIGPSTSYVTLRSEGKVRLVGARFFPWGFAPLFGVPADRLRDRVVPFFDLVGQPANELEERLSDATPEESVAALEQYLIRRSEASPTEAHPMIRALAESIVERPEEFKTQEIEMAAGLSMRQVERKFCALVGLSPMALSVVCRFDAARRTILRDPQTDLLDLMFQLGYYDYPHPDHLRADVGARRRVRRATPENGVGVLRQVS